MRKWAKRLGFTLAVLFGGFIVLIPFKAYYWQIVIGAPLERDLGFRHGTPYVEVDGSLWPCEVLTVESIIPGGVFDLAGFHKNDIVRGLGINGLFEVLHRGRGKEVTIHVVDWGDGLPPDQRPKRKITFIVPAKR